MNKCTDIGSIILSEQRTCKTILPKFIRPSMENNLTATIIIYYLRNRKHFPCFYRVIETRVKVWDKREISSFSQTFTSVSVLFLYKLYRNTEKMFSISFIK